MSWFSFDMAADEAICRAESDPEQAAEVLRIAAVYMRKGEALPENLATHLADAIDASMHKAPEHRGSALLLELNLKALNKRQCAYWYDVGEFMYFRADFEFPGEPVMSQNAAATAAAVKFGISESTAVRYYKLYADAIEEDRRIIEEEMRVELQNEEREEALGQAEHAIRQKGLEP